VPNKANAELREFAGQYTIPAIKGLLSIAEDLEMPPQARVGAWREILDRAVGKAPQAFTDPDGNALPPTLVTVVMNVDPDAKNRT
jgi:hypothetical protein